MTLVVALTVQHRRAILGAKQDGAFVGVSKP
jgi:hypothetical protein